MITRIDTKTRMSRIVIHNGVAHFCGQVGADSSADIREQTRSTLEKIDALLEQVGSNRTHILTTTIYLRDIKDFAAMNEIWDAWVPEGHAPARACVEARIAHPDLLVEMIVSAAVAE
jgi:enamine deaminase RidA (YjgF/YER057c/UK114 family)